MSIMTQLSERAVVYDKELNVDHETTEWESSRKDIELNVDHKTTD